MGGDRKGKPALTVILIVRNYLINALNRSISVYTTEIKFLNIQIIEILQTILLDINKAIFIC